MDKSLPNFDIAKVQRAFDAAADAYDEHAVLQYEVAHRLLSRLDWLKIEPQTILDLGAGTGQPILPLGQRHWPPRPHCVGIVGARGQC